MHRPNHALEFFQTGQSAVPYSFGPVATARRAIDVQLRLIALERLPQQAHTPKQNGSIMLQLFHVVRCAIGLGTRSNVRTVNGFPLQKGIS
jgi:hypothetical protein